MGTKDGITKDQVVKALGTKARQFVCKEWKQAK